MFICNDYFPISFDMPGLHGSYLAKYFHSYMKESINYKKKSIASLAFSSFFDGALNPILVLL